MKNLGQMMKKAQEMQSRMTEMQENLALMQVEGSAADGLVTVRLSGKFAVLGITIEPGTMEGDAKTTAKTMAKTMEGLVADAFNDAHGKVAVAKQEMIDEMTGGLPLPPGIKLPF